MSGMISKKLVIKLMEKENLFRGLGIEEYRGQI
jgi:hypothetical protein